MIHLASYPRSGNTFFRIVARLCFSVGCSEGYPGPIDVRGMKAGEMKIQQIIGNVPSPDLPVASTGLLKTHELPPPGDSRPAIYLVRDGRDAYVSLAHFMLKYQRESWPGMEFLDVLRVLVQNPGYFGGWSQNVRAWISRDTPVAVVRFEDLINEPAQVVADACRKVGIPVPGSSATLPGFAELSAEWPEMFRRGKAGAWKDEMTADIEDLFWLHHGEVMEQLGYRR